MSQAQQKEKFHTVVVKEFKSTFRGHKRSAPGKPGRRRKQFHITIRNSLPESDDRVQKLLADRQSAADVRRIKAASQRLAREASHKLHGIFVDSVREVLGVQTATQFEQSKKQRRGRSG